MHNDIPAITALVYIEASVSVGQKMCYGSRQFRSRPSFIGLGTTTLSAPQPDKPALALGTKSEMCSSHGMALGSIFAIQSSHKNQSVSIVITLIRLLEAVLLNKKQLS